MRGLLSQHQQASNCEDLTRVGVDDERSARHAERPHPADDRYHPMLLRMTDSSPLVKSPSRSGKASERRTSARMSALVGPRSRFAAGAALTYSTPRLCALLMTERCDTLPKSLASCFAFARLRGAALRIAATILSV